MKYLFLLLCLVPSLALANNQDQSGNEDNLNNPKESLAIPENCSVWNDGCNVCKVEDGELSECTERTCDVLNDSFCEQYSGSEVKNPNTLEINSPTRPPEEGFIEPTSPPPYDNSSDAQQGNKKLWRSVKNFFSSMAEFFSF